MPVARFSVENYRSFAMRAEVELRPLTLVFGRNSAGKSALLRVLPLLAEAARTSTTDPITLGTPLTRKALFEDIRSRLTRHPWMRFSLEFVPEPGGVGFTFKVSDALENKQQVLEEFSITEGARSLTAVWDVDEKAHVAHRLVWHNADTGANASTLGRLNPFFRPLFGAVAMPSPEIALLGTQLRNALDLFADGVHHLGATRVSPERFLERIPARPARIEVDGSDALQRLAFDRMTPDRWPLHTRVESWFLQHFGHRLDLRAVSGSRLFRALVAPRGGRAEIDLCDTGEGLAQVLPVLVALAEVELRAAQSPQLLVLEQPELHLHLDAQHTLMQMFCEVAAGPRPPTLLVETHSESMLVALQRAIVEGRVPIDKVLVYVVRQDADGHSYADRVTFDDEGYPSAAWPTEMFHEVVRSARALDLMRMKREHP
jgi:hypothetical protein